MEPLFYIILVVCAVGYSVLSDLIVPKKDRGWPGTKYREPKD